MIHASQWFWHLLSLTRSRWIEYQYQYFYDSKSIQRLFHHHYTSKSFQRTMRVFILAQGEGKKLNHFEEICILFCLSVFLWDFYFVVGIITDVKIYFMVVRPFWSLWNNVWNMDGRIKEYHYSGKMLLICMDQDIIDRCNWTTIANISPFNKIKDHVASKNKRQ